MRTVFFRRLLSTVFVCLATFSFCGAVIGEESVSLRSFYGPLSLIVSPDTWAQRFVTVSNDSDSPRRVKVTFVTADPKRGQLEYFTIVTVPAKSSLQTRLAVKHGKSTDTKKVKLKSKIRFRTEEFVQLHDANTGRRLGDPQRRPATVKTPTATILAFSADRFEDGDTYRYLGDLRDKELGTLIEKMSCDPKRLCDRWFGYEIADVMILGSAEMSRMRVSQIDALLNWVRRGGLLVLTGSVQLPNMLSGPLGQAAGVSATGYHRITSLQLNQIPPRKKAVKTVKLSWAAPMVELCAETADVLIESDGLPLMTRKRLGSGHIFTIAVPLGALKDKSLHFIWRQVARAKDIRPAVNDDAFKSPARSTLTSIAGRPAPERSVPVIILLSLAGLALLGGIVLRRKRRGEIVWIVLCPAAIVCGLVLWHIGLQQKDPERISYIGMLSGMDGETARTHCLFTYYSGGEAKKVTFSSGSTKNIIEDISKKSDAAISSEKTRCDEKMSLPDQTVRPRATAAFVVDGISKTQGITGKLTFNETGLSGELTNHLGFEIRNAVIYVNHRTYRLGNISAKKRTGVSVKDGDLIGRVEFVRQRLEKKASATWERRKPRKKRTKPDKTRKKKGAKQERRKKRKPRPIKGRNKYINLAQGEFTNTIVHSPTDRLRNALLQRIVSIPSMSSRPARRPVLIGYASQGPIDPLPEQKLHRSGWWVVVWPLELTAPKAKSKVFIPEGFVDVKFAKGKTLPVWNEISQKFNRDNSRDGEVVVLAGPPRKIFDLDKTIVRLTTEINAIGYRMTVLGIVGAKGAAAKTEVIKKIDNPSGTETVTITNADRFRQNNGRYAFIVRVERLGKKTSAGKRKKMNMWTIENINVSLEGISR